MLDHSHPVARAKKLLSLIDDTAQFSQEMLVIHLAFRNGDLAVKRGTVIGWTVLRNKAVIDANADEKKLFQFLEHIQQFPTAVLDRGRRGVAFAGRS